MELSYDHVSIKHITPVANFIYTMIVVKGHVQNITVRCHFKHPNMGR